MLDNGGESAAPRRADRKAPIRPRYRRPEPERPATRPVSVWIVSLLLVGSGVLGAAYVSMLLEEVTFHPEGDEVVAGLAFSMLLAGVQVAIGVFVFVGAGFGPALAMVVCALDIVVVIVGAATDRLGSGQSWLAVGFYGALLFGLAGAKIHAWCQL
jgi:hypothetical protein